MSNYIIVADIHIKVGQKNVPTDWQKNRIMMLAEELHKKANTLDDPTIVIAGDLLDVANPKLEEVGILYDFLKQLAGIPIILIPGNHEMITKTRDCFSLIDNMLEDLGVRVIRSFETIDNVDFIPYNVLFKDWPETSSPTAITHVRGEIPPHVKPEIPLERFDCYTEVFAGDLHSRTNSQRNILYPGSPYSTSFHRSIPSGANGYFIFNTYDLDHEWVELELPQLVKKTVSTEAEMVKTDYHHTMYELEGTLEDLAKIKNSDLLDKKVTKDISTPATLNLTGDYSEELVEYLSNVKGLDSVDTYVSLFKEIILDSD